MANLQSIKLKYFRSLENGHFLTNEFILLHFNIFCRDLGAEYDARHYPAEVAAVRFSLENGLSDNPVHDVIHPGDIEPCLM